MPIGHSRTIFLSADVTLTSVEAFTQIPNKVLEALVSSPMLNGTDVKIVLHVSRKTIGFHKSDDWISISQFQKTLGLSRPTIIKSIQKLLRMNVLVRVDIGTPKGAYSRYRLNHHSDEWDVFKSKLVKKPLLVKKSSEPSKDTPSNLVKKSLPTKELHTKDRNTKDNVLFFSPKEEQVIKQIIADHGHFPIDSEACEVGLKEIVRLVANKIGVKNPVGYARGIAQRYYSADFSKACRQ